MPARLHLPGKGAGPGKVEAAAALVSQLALAFPARLVHVVADAAYHGPALRTLPENVTWTCRIPRNAVLYALAPPRTGRRGRPRTKGERPGTPNVLGAGEARNRVRRAAERTVPFALLVHTLIIIWYARYGHDPADVDDRRAAPPWYQAKTEPAFEDMLIKLRRTMIAAGFSPTRPGQPADEQIRAVLAAWEAATAQLRNFRCHAPRQYPATGTPAGRTAPAPGRRRRRGPARAAVATNCAASPASCGYPGAATTGVPAGTTLQQVPGQASSGPGWKYVAATNQVTVTGPAPSSAA